MASAYDDRGGDYVAETQESGGESPSDSDYSEGRAFFFSREYTSRDDISKAVIEYNEKHGRAFRVKSSDHRRFKALCVDYTCNFAVSFAYGRGFEPPNTFVPHTCDATTIDLASYNTSRATKASFLEQLDGVRQFVIDHGRGASPVELQQKLTSDGRHVTYQACLDACTRLKRELFKEDSVQCQYVLSYIHEPNKRGHKADIELRDNKVWCGVIVYKPGIHVLRVFADRGLNLDGTFMKHEYGGALLVACLKNSNNEIQIVAVAWVSGETKDNWSWFLSYLLCICSAAKPAFVISDRDKGLIPAMQAEAASIPHYVCVRHMLENFNTKFKNETLKNQAWKLAKSLTAVSFDRRADQMKEKNEKALQWLLDADKFKWAAAFSLYPRFGTMTSNNVESVNSALVEAREKPLLDCHETVEKYVGAKWVEFVTKATTWGHLTAYVTKKFERNRLASVVDKIEIMPSCASSFVAKVCKDGELPVEYAIDLDDPERPCSCGYFNYQKAPCAHLIAALRSVNKLSQVKNFYDASWTTNTYRRAYDPLAKMSPYVTKDDLQRFDHHQPPPVPKKRGRPKKSKKRIESQSATEVLKTKRKNKCASCGGAGHNKRTCKR